VRPRIIAHRGASGTCPENTLAAFRRATSLGADMIELDVQLTCDGHVVVIHDLLLDRTTDGTGLVAERTLDEIAALDAGSWFGPAFAGERVPTLGAVLGTTPLAVNVELKAPVAPGLEARVLEVVGRSDALGRIVFSSFEVAALDRLRALAPSADLGVFLEEPAALSMALRVAQRVGARALHVRKDVGTAEVLSQIRAAGLVSRVWTVNATEDFDRLAAAGADAIFTDFPERFLLAGGDAPGAPNARPRQYSS
jgi:glycerophosphoryl diester phosphodiesterase